MTNADTPSPCSGFEPVTLYEIRTINRIHAPTTGGFTISQTGGSLYHGTRSVFVLTTVFIMPISEDEYDQKPQHHGMSKAEQRRVSTVGPSWELHGPDDNEEAFSVR
jgi:hypothetical protein